MSLPLWVGYTATFSSVRKLQVSGDQQGLKCLTLHVVPAGTTTEGLTVLANA